MFAKVFVLIYGLQVATVLAQFNGGFQGNGFNNGFDNGGFNGGFQPIQQQTSTFQNKAFQQQGQAAGNSAAAGNAAALGLGSASSINQANHQADQFNTASNSLSANTAQGTQGSQAGGAAQAGGQVQNAKMGQSNFGQNSAFFQGRRKRQIGYGNFGGGYGNGFGFPQSQANANSLGGGSANYGDVATNNNAFSQTNPFGGSGFAAGNSAGQGQGVSIFQAANTNSQSGYYGRRKRQIGYGGYGGFGMPQSNAGANSIGGGSALFGNVATNNNGFSQTNPYGANGFAAGNSMGSGQGVSIFNAANTNAASGIFG